MPYKEKEISRLYYPIGEVAEMFNVNTSLIRFWENEFEILQPKKNKKGNRLFTPEDVENIKLIYHLVKEKGYTLQGAKDKLKTGKLSLQENRKVVDSLEKLKAFMVQLKDQL